MSETDENSNIELPIVTVFGAGIAGLSAAHELVERGFRVQVVEPRPSPTHEYQCAAGGVAANQFTRVRASLQTLHPWLMTKDNIDNLKHALKFRDWQPKIERTAPRYPLNQKIRFSKRAYPPTEAPQQLDDALWRGPHEPTHAERPTLPKDWRDYWDAYGVKNRVKMEAVFDALRTASQVYMRRYFKKLAELIEQGGEPKDAKEWYDYSPIFDPPASAKEFVARETSYIRIIGYTDTDGVEEENRRYAECWATRVRDELIRLNDLRKVLVKNRDPAGATDSPIWELERRLEIVVRGSAGVKKDPVALRQRSFLNRVEFEVVEQIVPGEHGFRFFPGFYRHLFDTMKRTPFYDASGAISTSAYDQLVPTPHAQLAIDGALYNFDARDIDSLKRLGAAQDLLTNRLGFKSKDMLGLQFQTLRYLTSGANRRESEAEPINLLDYIGASSPDQRFSQECLNFINRAPRALAAMSASESDARTQFDITAQLLLPGLPDPMTLNGPTSLVWLDHWKHYLKQQGVNFFVGKIAGMKELVSKNGDVRYVPVVQGPQIGRKPELAPLPEDADGVYLEPTVDRLDQHRFVLATQFQQASDIVWDAYKNAVANRRRFEGPFRQFITFDEASGRRRKRDDMARRPVRDPATGQELGKWPLRTISGVQFFFPQAYRFGQSNIYFAFSPYGLTSISQYAFWRRHSQPVGRLLGQISIDIGDWHSPYPAADRKARQAQGQPAFYSSSQEIADATWAQIKTGLSPAFSQVIEQPGYYHLDINMVFSEIELSSDPKEVGWWTVGAVRANALVRAPNDVHVFAPFALTSKRCYKIGVRVGADGPEQLIELKKPSAGEESEANSADAKPNPEPLRDLLLKTLQKQAAGVVVAAAGLEKTDIVISPIVSLASATLRVLKASDDDFTVWLNGAMVVAKSPSDDVNEIVESLRDELEVAAKSFVSVTRIAGDALTLAPLPGVNAPMSFAVLNVDRAIELVGAPPVVVRAFNLLLPEPDEGFALLRNDYEYLINVPDQWRLRPGLRRGADAESIPPLYNELATNFGVKRPEICYLHPPTCTLLQFWVGAGAHMATYTRMTTMEAAAESGRHAAAALIFDLFEANKNRKHYRALAGDFPAIFPVEENEIEDLSFFTALDDELFSAGLPHLFDILGISRIVQSAQESNASLPQMLSRMGLAAKEVPGVDRLSPKVIGALTKLVTRFVGGAPRAT